MHTAIHAYTCYLLICSEHFSTTMTCHVCIVSCPCSIFGAIRTGSFMMYILMTKGLKQSVCDQSFYNGPVSKFWAYAFVLSKAPELGKS